MLNRINILDVYIDDVNMIQALEKIDLFLNQNMLNTIYTPNSEIMMEAQTDPELKEILRSGSLVVPDGAGVVLAAKILGYDLSGRLAGYDLMEAVLERYASSGTGIFLLGAKPEVNEAAAINIVAKYKGIKICGYHHGYFKEEETSMILEKIRSSSPDILFVGLGSPKQEKWINENRARIKAKIAMGVGGSFDGFAGSFPRAPEFYRKNNLEWLYRLYKEPKRFSRMLRIPRFLIRVIKTRLFGR